MQITFVSNYINHHQIPVSDELYRLSEGKYTFIQTEPMEEERLSMGWSMVERPYLMNYYDNPIESGKLMMTSDCVIFGGTEKEELIIPRLEANKFTIRYSERLYKEGRWKFISPRGLLKKYHDHVRFNKSNVYLLCSGAYVAGDFNLIHAYPHKKMKYGYFPQFVEYSDVHELRRNNEKTVILWAARFIDWKHPEIMVKLARFIKDRSIEAHIVMIGNGDMYSRMVEDSTDLQGVITFVGAKKPDEVRKYMRMADIFISTSDRREGWGAVVNEAMNSGCVTIAAKEIGVAPYLINNGVNGFTYRACDTFALCKRVESLCIKKEKMSLIGEEAYKTIRDIWNPKVAAERLFEFINADNRNILKYEEGPLSRA